MQDAAEVVIVDDHRAFLDTLVPILQTYDIKVVGCAENGLQLFEILQNHVPDVILLDIEMPQMDGSQAVDRLKKQFPGTKTIILSQYDDSILIQDFLNRGVNGYITKNTDVRTIAKAVHDVKKRGFYRENLEHLSPRHPSPRKNGVYKATFSRREREIILLICKGMQINEIAGNLSIAEKTVEANITEIYKKAKVSTRAEFLIYAIQEGLNYLGAL